MKRDGSLLIELEKKRKEGEEDFDEKKSRERRRDKKFEIKKKERKNFRNKKLLVTNFPFTDVPNRGEASFEKLWGELNVFFSLSIHPTQKLTQENEQQPIFEAFLWAGYPSSGVD